MTRRLFAPAAVSMLAVLAACGGSDDGAATDSVATASETVVGDAETTEPTPPESAVATEPTVTAGTAGEPDGVDGCPIGTWQVDGPGLEPFYALAAPPDVTFTPSGRFVIEIGTGSRPYVCDGSTLTVTYDTPSGPAVVVFSPA